MIRDIVSLPALCPGARQPWGDRGPGQARTQGEPEPNRGRPGEKTGKTKAPQKMRCAFVPIRTGCACCGREYFKRRAWQRTCSRECQLVYLAARKVLKAYQAGRADGLCGLIKKLAEVKR
jgi:hypothetical protein